VRVLGIDPGTKALGWAVVEQNGRSLSAIDSGVFSPPKGELAPRLLEINRFAGGLIERFSPDTIALEAAFYQKNIATTLRLGEVRAAVVIAAAQRVIPVKDLEPRVVKKSVTGNGAATKAQVVYMVQKLLSIPSCPSVDQSDALALAICLINRTKRTL